MANLQETWKMIDEMMSRIKKYQLTGEEPWVTFNRIFEEYEQMKNPKPEPQPETAPVPESKPEPPAPIQYRFKTEPDMTLPMQSLFGNMWRRSVDPRAILDKFFGNTPPEPMQSELKRIYETTAERSTTAVMDGGNVMMVSKLMIEPVR